MGFNAARGYPGQGDRRHGAARPVERKLGPSRATVGARLKMTFTSHLGPAGAGVQQQHEQRSVTPRLEGVTGAGPQQPLDEVPPLSRRLPNLVHLDQGGSLQWQHHASTHRS
jgi:hypothetical protein